MATFVTLQLLLLLVRYSSSYNYTHICIRPNGIYFLCPENEIISKIYENSCDSIEEEKSFDNHQNGTSSSLNQKEIISIRNEKSCNAEPKAQPFNTIITCENSLMSLSCDSESVINIIDANYGRNNQTTCGFYEGFSTDCSAKDSYYRVKQRCQNKQKCSIKASNSEFGDPCQNIIKYLIVKYTCEKLKWIKKQITTSEHNWKEIVCPEGTKVFIVDGYYGVNSCKAMSSVDILSSICDYKQKCTVSASNYVFGDPCPNKLKSLSVDYQCISDEVEYVRHCEHEKFTIKCNNNKAIDIISAHYGKSHPFMCQDSSVSQLKPGCLSTDVTIILKDNCHGKIECDISVENKFFNDPCYGNRKYLDLEYACIDTSQLLDVRVGSIEAAPVSPGAPNIISVRHNSVRFYADGLDLDLAHQYKIQIKNTDGEDLWYDVYNGIKIDFSKDQTIYGLEPGKEYDIRIIIKTDFTSNCIPFTRFVTKNYKR